MSTFALQGKVNWFLKAISKSMSWRDELNQTLTLVNFYYFLVFQLGLTYFSLQGVYLCTENMVWIGTSKNSIRLQRIHNNQGTFCSLSAVYVNQFVRIKFQSVSPLYEDFTKTSELLLKHDAQYWFKRHWERIFCSMQQILKLKYIMKQSLTMSSLFQPYYDVIYQTWFQNCKTKTVFTWKHRKMWKIQQI